MAEPRFQAARYTRVPGFVTPRVKLCDMQPPRPYRELPTTAYTAGIIRMAHVTGMMNSKCFRHRLALSSSSSSTPLNVVLMTLIMTNTGPLELSRVVFFLFLVAFVSLQ